MIVSSETKLDQAPRLGLAGRSELCCLSYANLNDDEDGEDARQASHALPLPRRLIARSKGQANDQGPNTAHSRRRLSGNAAWQHSHKWTVNAWRIKVTNRKVGVADKNDKTAIPSNDHEFRVSEGSGRSQGVGYERNNDKDPAQDGLAIRSNAQIGIGAGQSRLWITMAPPR
jgi:hypothetical protein